MTDTTGVIADLTAEAAEVDALVAGLAEAEWDTPTPAPGWHVRHQIAHLAFIFRIAGLSAAQPEAFVAMTKSLSGGFEAAVNAALEDYIHDPAEVLLTRWRAERDAGLKALAAVPGDRFVPWLVNPLPPYVLACAGMMGCSPTARTSPTRSGCAASAPTGSGTWPGSPCGSGTSATKHGT